jgi:HSP20 family protein
MRSAASAMLDAERALDQVQRQFAHYPLARFGDPRVRFSGRGAASPRIDARENETEYVITAELPGVDGTELDVVVEDGVLTLKREVEVVSKESEEAEAKTERQLVFQRRIRFNGEIDETSVKATYKNGLLTVIVPKPEVVKPEVRTIPVEVG